jgi:hypothetical protein
VSHKAHIPAAAISPIALHELPPFTIGRQPIAPGERMDGQEQVHRVQTRMRTSLALLVVAVLVMPAIGSGQTLTAPASPPEGPPPFRLFKDTPRESSREWIGSMKSPNWWEPPAGGSEIPRWTIGHSVALNTAGGFALSAGLFGRRGDPLPLYLSEGRQGATGNSITGPGTYRLQWDLKFGVSAPVLTGPRLKINAFGELFVPLTRPRGLPGPSATLLTSPTPRFGIVTVF